MNDTLGVRGDLRYEVWDASTLVLGDDGWPVSGRVVSRGLGRNLVVTTGLTMIRDRMHDATGTTAPSRFALGTDGRAAVASDSGLWAQVWPDATVGYVALLTRAQPGTTGQAIYQYFLPSTAANVTPASILREAALRNAVNTQLARYVLADAIEKTNAIAVTFTWRITFSR